MYSRCCRRIRIPFVEETMLINLNAVNKSTRLLLFDLFRLYPQIPILLSLREFSSLLHYSSLAGSQPLPVIFYKRPGRTQSTSEIMTLIKRVGLRCNDSRQVLSSVHYPCLEKDQPARVFRARYIFNDRCVNSS